MAAVRLLVGPRVAPRRSLRIGMLALSVMLAVGTSTAFALDADAEGGSSPTGAAAPSSSPRAFQTADIVIVPLAGGNATTQLSTTQFPTASLRDNTCLANSSPTSPPPGGGTTSPPPGGGTTSPPPGGGTTSPPSGSGATTPPSGTGTTSAPAGVSGTATTSPSVSPSVLGVTFVNPPPKQGGGLPFTGLPLTRLLAIASALVGAGRGASTTRAGLTWAGT